MRFITKAALLEVLVSASLLLAACAGTLAPSTTTAPATTEATPKATMQMQPEPGKVTVAGASVRAAPLAGGNSAAYMTVLNGTDKAVRLSGVAGTVAPAIELHESVNDNGVIKMEPRPEGFEIPAGGSLELKPGGKHVMIMGIEKPLAEGETVDLSLTFDNGEVIKLTAPVVNIAMTNMAGMGNMQGGEMTEPAMTPTTAP